MLLHCSGSLWQLGQMAALQASAVKRGEAHLGAQLLKLTWLSEKSLIVSVPWFFAFRKAAATILIRWKHNQYLRVKKLQASMKVLFCLTFLIVHECSFHTELTPHLEKTCLCGCWTRAKSDTGSILLPWGISTFLILISYGQMFIRSIQVTI